MHFFLRIFGFLIPIVATLAGYAWGMSLKYTDISRPPNRFTYLGAFAVLLILLGQVYAIRLTFKKTASSPQASTISSDGSLGLLLPVLLAGYSIFFMLGDPFLFPPRNYGEMIMKILLLVPFILSSGYFCRKG